MRLRLRNHKIIDYYSHFRINPQPKQSGRPNMYASLHALRTHGWLTQSLPYLQHGAPVSRSPARKLMQNITYANIQLIISDSPQINKSTIRLSKHGHAAPEALPKPGVSVLTVGISHVSPGSYPDHKHPMC